MRRVWIALLVSSVTLALAIPVGAAPPKCADDPPAPRCPPVDEEPMVVNDSCHAHGEWDPVPVSRNFEVTLGGRDTAYPSGYCIDVMAEPGDWQVDIETTGKVQSLNLFLRDSVGAGDGCFTAPDGSSSCGYMFRNNIPAVAEFADMPGAWVNACGIEWGEYVGSSWEDGIFTLGEWHAAEDHDVASPLAFLPGIRAGSDATVVLKVYFPNDNSTPVSIDWPQG